MLVLGIPGILISLLAITDLVASIILKALKVKVEDPEIWDYVEEAEYVRGNRVRKFKK